MLFASPRAPAASRSALSRRMLACAQLNTLDVETCGRPRRRVGHGWQTRRARRRAPSAAPSPPPSATDAATLLGSDEAANELPMFGQQLFRRRPAKLRRGIQSRLHARNRRPGRAAHVGLVHVRSRAAHRRPRQRVHPERRVLYASSVWRNNELNDIVRLGRPAGYRDNVDVYASLEASQPCACSSPASCGRRANSRATAAESVLGYLTRAGGIDPGAAATSTFA